MINKIIFYLAMITASTGCLSAVTPESCVEPGRSVDNGMINAMVSDFGIKEQDLQLDKTKMQLIYQEEITPEMALMYARDDRKSSAFKSEKLEGLMSNYEGGSIKNIIVKYVYENKSGKVNKFIASLLIDDYECSVRFNNYIVLLKEF